MTPKRLRGGPEEARAHLHKAQEYYDAAADSLAAGRLHPACSDAVVSAINAADAICLAIVQTRSAGPDHDDTVVLLDRAGPLGQEAADLLQAIVRLKNLAQYRDELVKPDDATRAVSAARQVLELARRAVADLPA